MKPLMKYHVTVESQDGTRVKTWGVFPVGDTKILDGIYNPDTKGLSLLLDSVTEQYTPFQVQTKNGKYEMQQRKIDQYYRIHIPETDVAFFLDTFVQNDFEIEPEIEKPSLIIES